MGHYDIDYREEDLVLINTAYNLINKGPDALGAFFVPGDAQRITAVRIHTAADWVADDPSGFSSAVHLTGMGLKNRDKNYAFPGPFAFTTPDNADTSSGAYVGDAVTYRCNIPVIGGNEIVAMGYYWGVLCNGVRCGVWL
ncbi:unnamed protein product, partial [marine sediment metagenome]